MWNRKVFIRIIEVLLCIACVIALRVTDDESRRVFHYLRNRSREWSLLNNVTWGVIGAALATVTCGGYIIVTTGLLVAAATGELRGRKTELSLLGLGIILFAIVGALSLASIENVPEDLIDNAAVLGSLCLLTALVFIADLLMGTPRKKEKTAMLQSLDDKNAAKRQITTTLTTEHEPKSTKTTNTTDPTESKDSNKDSDASFEKMDSQPHKEKEQDRTEDFRKVEQNRLVSAANQYPQNTYEEERNRNYDRLEREFREYKHNIENEKALRDSQRYRDSEMRKTAGVDYYDSNHRMDEPRVIYRTQDIYQRPVDEVDTPRFPTEMESRAEPVFAKIINPGVKIMKVERNVEDVVDNYRYSDTSQYDNVPTRLRGTSSGILKKGRDVSFNVQGPKGQGHERSRDEIEVLDECFSALRTASTGTQTGIRIPSSPTDPGYVRHTASNWPHEQKTKTPGSSPEHSRHG